MGNAASSAKQTSTFAFHVIKIEPNSPASDAQLCEHFDYIVEVEKNIVTPENANMFLEWTQSALGKQMHLTVYNSVAKATRELCITPRNNWGGNGLLGCTVRLGLCDNAAKVYWRILDVSDNSPAQAAGLVSWKDYIVGLPAEEVFDANNLLWKIEKAVGSSVEVIVFNVDAGLRTVALWPTEKNAEEGLLGCDVANGLSHSIPYTPVSVPEVYLAAKQSGNTSETPSTEHRLQPKDDTALSGSVSSIYKDMPYSSHGSIKAQENLSSEIERNGDHLAAFSLAEKQEEKAAVPSEPISAPASSQPLHLPGSSTCPGDVPTAEYPQKMVSEMPPEMLYPQPSSQLFQSSPATQHKEPQQPSSSMPVQESHIPYDQPKEAAQTIPASHYTDSFHPAISAQETQQAHQPQQPSAVSPVDQTDPIQYSRSTEQPHIHSATDKTLSEEDQHKINDLFQVNDLL